MKWMCVVLLLTDGPGGHSLERTEKPLESLRECQAWRHQQQFAPSVRPSMATGRVLYFCEPYWDA